MNKEDKTIVETLCGKVMGEYKDGLFIYKGIPYASPPVGKDRWLPPGKVEPWKRILRAQAYKPTCPQNWSPLNDLIPDFGMAEPQDEDCLYMNIWSPGLDDTSRPVLFWIHGGAFNVGSGSQSPYNANKLATRGDVVVITFNYRLGPFGFLRLNEITGGRIPSTGNEGLLDQIAALEWVRDNISAFGGDPGNVTVFGESAGGMSIECLLTMPKSRGLFHKAIIQSSLGEIPGAPLEMAVKIGGEFPGVLGVSPSDTDAMRALTTSQLLSAGEDLRAKISEIQGEPAITVTTPVMDGVTVPELPLKAIRTGCAKNIPVLIGSNLEEFRLFGMLSPEFSEMGENELVKGCQSFIPAEHVKDLVETYRKARAARGEDITPAGIFTAIQTDFMFRMPAIHFIEAQKGHAPVYNYILTWKSPAKDGVFGACHAMDIAFVFGTHNDSFWGSGTAADRLSDRIQVAWLAFARNGDPNCESLGEWPVYGDKRIAMLLGEECHTVELPYEEERSAWDQVPSMLGR
ncbi:carboxylesterase/lipase family protein [Thermodesulfobacteriota bacterium]